MVQRKLNLKIMEVKTSLADLKKLPDLKSNLETQLLFGEKIEVICKKNEGWFFCKSLTDNYKGWIKKDQVSIKLKEKNFKVSALTTLIYEKPDIKSNLLNRLHLNSKLQVLKSTNNWSSFYYKDKIAFVFNKHISTILEKPKAVKNFVKTAKNFLNTVYLWGGKSHLGLDCSGLVQLCLENQGVSFPRNTKDQFHCKILKSINEDEINKGTLIFWKGHVAIAINKSEIIHANAYHMRVVIENLETAKKRIEPIYGNVVGYKKLIEEN